MNNRRRMTGVVTSNKMTKTVVVEITRVYRHPLYRKVVHSSKRVKAHDEIGCQIGDQVQIVESRPLSRDKRWAVQAILARSEALADAIAQAEAEKAAAKAQAEAEGTATEDGATS